MLMEFLEIQEELLPSPVALARGLRPPAPAQTKHAEQSLKPPLASGCQSRLALELVPFRLGSPQSGGVQSRRAGRSCARRWA